MLNTTRNQLVLALSLVLTACGGDDSGTGEDDTTDTDPDPSGNDSSVSVTLTTTTQGSATDPSSDTGTSDDPTGSTGDTPPTTETTADPDSSSGSESGTDGESGSDSSSSGGTADDTIYDIQMGVIAEGADVVVRDVVVTAIGPTPTRFWAQEEASGEYSGILVYAGDQGETLGIGELQIGDVVDVSGTVVEFSDLTEIDLSMTGTLDVTGATTPLEPDVVDIDVFGSDDTAEPWESTLVRVEGALDVTEVNGAQDEFTVAIGADSVTVDNFVYNAFDDAGTGETFDGLAVGATFTAVQGPVNFFASDWKIIPRSADELEGYSGPL